MKTKHTQLKKFYRKNQLATNLVVAAVLIAGVGSAVTGIIYNAPTKVDSAISSANRTPIPTAKKKPAVVEASPSAISDSTPTEQSKSAKPSYSPDSIMGEKERMKDPAYRKANLAPMKVISVTSYARSAVNCDSYGKTLRIQYVIIMTNHALGGTIRYQLEERQNGAINVLFAGAGSVEDLNGHLETPSLYAYGASGNNADSAIRVHVTSPNDVSSPWYVTGDCPGLY
jgi:hypothetical protein